MRAGLFSFGVCEGRKEKAPAVTNYRGFRAERAARSRLDRTLERYFSARHRARPLGVCAQISRDHPCQVALRIALHFDFSGCAPATHSLPKNQDKIATRPTQSHSRFGGQAQPPVAQHREADNSHATHSLKVSLAALFPNAMKAALPTLSFSPTRASASTATDVAASNENPATLAWRSVRI